jgi:hypothetical protein
MNHRRFAASALVVGTAAVTIVGCGGGSKGLAKADLDTKANAICKSVTTKIDAVKQPSDLLTNANSAAAYFDKVVPLAQDGTKQLQSLKPADAVKSDWNAYVAAQVAETNALAAVKTKADKHDASGVADLQKVQPLSAKVTSTANAVGATACADN